MKQVQIFLAFAFGCVTALALGFGGDATARHSEPGVGAGQPASLEERLNALEQRAGGLELAATGGQIGNRVVAPFVVNQGRRPIFDVNAVGDTASVNVHAGKGLAVMENGAFTAYSASGNLRAGLDAGELVSTQGLFVRENDKERIVLGKDTKKSNYNLSFLSSSGQVVAGIGEAADTHEAVALVFDKSGNLRARMGATTDGKGIVDVLVGKNIPIAQLTESESGGGKLIISNAGGMGMVEAGDAGGYGIVRAGPKGFEFIPTPGLALPGSVLVGKR